MAASVVANTEIHQFLSQSPVKLFIGGKGLQASDSRTFKTFDPGTGELLAEVYEATPEDVATAVEAATDAFRQLGWSQLQPNERAVYLHRLADLVEARKSIIA